MNKRLKEALANAGVVITGSHFVYTKGTLADDPKIRDHGPDYVAKELVPVDPAVASLVGAEMASLIFRQCRELGLTEIDIVAPVVGAVVLGQWATHHAVGLGLKARSFFADKADTGFKLRDIYAGMLKGRNVVVVEDILNSGGSAAETVEAVKAIGANVIMVVALCNRGGVTADKLGVSHLAAIMNVSLEKFPGNDCPLCKQGVPIDVRVGHGKEFLEQQAATKA